MIRYELRKVLGKDGVGKYLVNCITVNTDGKFVKECNEIYI